MPAEPARAHMAAGAQRAGQGALEVSADLGAALGTRERALDVEREPPGLPAQLGAAGHAAPDAVDRKLVGRPRQADPAERMRSLAPGRQLREHVYLEMRERPFGVAARK